MAGAWEVYTDHHAVALFLRRGHLCVPPSAPVQAHGATAQTARNSRNRSKALSRRVWSTDVNWTQLSTVCHQAALSVLGSKATQSFKPWLDGNLDQLKQLDEHIALALKADREAGAVPQPCSLVEQRRVVQVRDTLHRGRRQRSRALQAWMATYWSGLATA